jgi:hypothetical protein
LAKGCEGESITLDPETEVIGNDLPAVLQLQAILECVINLPARKGPPESLPWPHLEVCPRAAQQGAKLVSEGREGLV